MTVKELIIQLLNEDPDDTVIIDVKDTTYVNIDGIAPSGPTGLCMLVPDIQLTEKR